MAFVKLGIFCIVLGSYIVIGWLLGDNSALGSSAALALGLGLILLYVGIGRIKKVRKKRDEDSNDKTLQS